MDLMSGWYNRLHTLCHHDNDQVTGVTVIFALDQLHRIIYQRDTTTTTITSTNNKNNNNNYYYYYYYST